jgi:hypothetical protein
MEYDIDNLIDTFEKHEKQWKEQHEKNKINFPDAEWVKDDFSLPLALLKICKEIKKLKDKN